MTTSSTYTIGQRITVDIKLWHADANHKQGGTMSVDRVTGVIHKINRCSVRLNLDAPRGGQRTPENGLWWDDRIVGLEQIVG